MAEQSSHDVVNQTLSGGEPSPSDVPASTNDKKPAGGDVGEITHTATTTPYETKANAQQNYEEANSSSLSAQKEMGKDVGASTPDTSKNGPGPIATRALEMNGRAASSDGGDDTGSQGGSESDASHSKQPTRAGSVKKPTPFKPVSFAKFAMPKAPGTSAANKSPEKVPLSTATPLGVPQQPLRPRLVAKSTSGLRGSLSKSGTSAAKPGGNGPDPNQVWNRNRPTQPPPPKHLTDEELKQQYGIHMTSRIQEDGAATEGKWADIEDDEDDWAPETIEWTDGTKTNLTNTEPPPQPQLRELPQIPQIQQNQQMPQTPQMPQPAVQDTKPLAEQPKEASPRIEEASTFKESAQSIPKPTTSIGPNPTVLRLGANAERQAKNMSFSSKGVNDSSFPGSSSIAPPPTKSPWAPLPPVEKASPVAPSVHPVQHPSMEHHVSDGYGGPAPNGFAPGGPLHPKEIAADDFNRSWKEMQTGAPRELFNSRSGRYEPVPETRKGSSRNERGPSLLQRPILGDQAGPAEPSAAFQSYRAGGQDGAHWTRRRTSSNVSGGSGSFGRRMSIGRPDVTQRTFEARRGSNVNGMVEPPLPNRELPPSKGAPVRDVSPAQQVSGPSRTSAHMNEIPAAAAPQQPAPAAVEEPVPAPQVSEENPVAMQERIMKEKRMEARQRRIEQEQKEEAAKRERIRQKLEALGPAPDKSKPQRKESLETSQPESTASAVATSLSPPKPPVPEPTGAPKQYGMMKVHHPDTVKKLVERERPAEKPTSIGTANHAPSPIREPKQDAAVADGVQQPGEAQVQIPAKVSEPQADEQGQWRNNLHVSGAYSPWSPSTKFIRSPPLTNPWKPLSNDRTLGNGIFDQALGGFPAKDLPLRSHLGLDQPSIVPGSQPLSAPQEPTTISPLASPEVRHATFDTLSPKILPGPIGPPSSQNWPQEPRVAGTAAWNNFHAVAARREAEENEKRRTEMNAFREGPSGLQVNFNETWRQVRTGDQAGQRQVVGITRSAEPSVPASNPLSDLDNVGALPFPDSHTRPLGGVLPRSSRFFPQATEQVKKPAIDEEFIRSPSPPPPEEMWSHPVYTGDSNRPLVHLPAPKPIVKLPPKAVAPPAPPTFASMVATPPRDQPPVSSATTWQEKINGLFGKKTISEKRNALAVTSATKEPLDVPLHIAAVSVPLPHNIERDYEIEEGEIIAKQVEEAEAIFEDREAGSQPVVRVPLMAPPAAWHAAPAPSQPRPKSKNLIQVHSVEPYSFGFQEKDSAGNIRIFIRFPGADVGKTLTVSKKAGSHTSRQRGGLSFKPRKGAKPREATGSFNSKKPSPSQPAGANGGSPRHQSRNGSWTPRTSSGPR